MVHVHDYNFDHPGTIQYNACFSGGFAVLVAQEMCADFAASASVIISDAFDTELLLSCMQNLKHGKAVEIPNYNFKTYKTLPDARKVLLYIWCFP